MSPSSLPSEATVLAPQLPSALLSRLRPLSHSSACMDNKVTMTFKAGEKRCAGYHTSKDEYRSYHLGLENDTEIRKTAGYDKCHLKH